MSQIENNLEAVAPNTAPVVTIPPVYIEGDAGNRDPGVQRLVKAHDAAVAADCRLEGRKAGADTVYIGAAVLTTLAGVAAGPVGVGAGLLSLLGASLNEGGDLRSYYDCKTQ